MIKLMLFLSSILFYSPAFAQPIAQELTANSLVIENIVLTIFERVFYPGSYASDNEIPIYLSIEDEDPHDNLMGILSTYHLDVFKGSEYSGGYSVQVKFWEFEAQTNNQVRVKFGIYPGGMGATYTLQRSRGTWEIFKVEDSWMS